MGTDSRRPLKSRDTAWAKWLSRTLAARGVMPNHVSLASIVFAGVGAFAFAERAYSVGPAFDVLLLLVAIGGMQGRLLCNLIDGMIAVEGGKASPVGDLYNDIPDRISDALLLVGAGFGIQSVFPYGLSLGWLAAMVAIMTAYIRALGAACGTPHYFTGPMAKQQRMACLTGAAMLQILARLFGSSFVFVGWALVIILIGSLLTCVRRTKMITAALWIRRSTKTGAGT